MNSLISSPCDSPCEKLDAGDQEPCLGAFDGFLEVVNGGVKLGHRGGGKMDHSMVWGLSMESTGGTRARRGVPFEWADAAPRVGGPCGHPWASLASVLASGLSGFRALA